ncbi:DNase I-like protein [Cytidiella melzeri]|nr:DNase I-like protein [Cytidiella melzeri]
MMRLYLALALPATFVFATQITDIQGPAFRSPLEGVTVHNITGTVTAKASTGFYIQGTPSKDISVSHGLFVFSESSAVLNSVAPGDEISLSGKVTEFRGSSATDQAFLLSTELDSPSNIVVLSTGNKVAPLVLGPTGPGARSPPTQQLSALDNGPDGWLSVPNNVSRVDQVNATAEPAHFGIDFWSSLEGVLVTVKNPVGLDFQNSFGEFWVHGDWPVTGKNSRGGLTLTVGPNGVPDGNPETVIIGVPLDGTTNPNVSIGQTFTDITGVIQQQFGFYYILPLTAPTTLTIPSPIIPPTTLRKSTDPCTLVIGEYNVDNFAPNSTTMPVVASQIVHSLLMPDMIFLDEIQDNSGPTNNGVVDASLTLSTLAQSVVSQGGAFLYNFTEVISVNNQDGGETGGNIRPAYFFDSRKVSLVPGSPTGGPLDATAPVMKNGKLSLTFNPGRLDPNNTVWDSARKPLVAAWQTTTGQRFITINVHNTAKSDVPGSSTQGDDRPPVNLDVTKRQGQVETIATFIKSILTLDPSASIILGGDFNEYTFTRTVFASLDNLMFEADVLANVPPVERYTFAFDQNVEQLDHVFVSSAVALRGVQAEHVHVNNWQPTTATRGSDHDPSVVRVRVC